MRLRVKVRTGGKLTGWILCGELFRVPLLDQAKAAKVSFDAVKIAVMIGITSDEAVSTNPIVGLHSLYYLNREWDFSDPWTIGEFVFQIELCRCRVVHACFCAEIVSGPDHEVRLLSAHQ